MRILVITRNAWDDTNAIGNTISNFFGGMDDVEFATIYFRSALPNNQLCKNYYRTSEFEIMRKWFRPESIGERFCLMNQAHTIQGKISKGKEKSLIRFIQKHGSKLVYKLSDFLWYSKKWLNDNLDRFIEDFSPDIVFTFVKSAPQYYLTVKHLREKYNIPLFSWIADDEYTAFKRDGAQKEIDNLQYILKESAIVRGCSEEICDYYNSIFGCAALPLYKSCDLSSPIKTDTNDPLTIVYAGNFLYGRLSIICQIADALEEYAQSGMNVSFEIYSNTALTPHEVQKYFDQNQFIKYMGKKNYEFIKRRLSEADIVLHVESFDDEQILKTRYSFSTKILDCLQSGSVLLAVGPQEVASIKYISRIPGAYVINDLDSLPSQLHELLSQTTSFQQRANQIRKFASQNHDSASASGKLMQTIKETVEGGA